ncbi:MAG: hypothetical protein GY928_13150 [Colwellia sp.]|nr:hypothetical protein [Colwellia sp.]
MENSLSYIYSVLVEVDGYISKVAYKFIPEEQFKKIDNIPEMQLVYWSEIIQRFHISNATSLLRVKKWYEAMNAAYDNNNYYGFCAAIRGLLESCSDSFYSLGRVIFPIAENFNNIKIAIEGKSQKTLFAEEIEQELIHYIFGRKLSRSEQDMFPLSHNAKQVRKYLDSIDNASLNSLYSELCQISHPSIMSFLPFMMELDDHGLTLHNERIDNELNKNLLERHRKTIYNTTIYALGPSLCGLKIINKLNTPLLESLKTNEKAFKSLEGYGLWSSIEQAING